MRLPGTLIFFALLLCAFLGGTRGWPFVPFPMYAYLNPADPVTFRIEAIDPTGKPLPLDADRYFRPYLRQDILARVAGAAKAKDQQSLAELGNFVKRAFDAAAAQGYHQANSLTTLRIYRRQAGEETLFVERSWR